MFEKSFGQSFIFAAFQTYSGNFYITQSILEYIMEKSTHTSTRVFGSQESLGVKGIAIIMLICHHCFLGSARYKGQAVTFIIPENIWNYVALFFKICVCIFAFISAYGITWKIKSSCHFDSAEQTQKDFRNILLSRLIRLLTSFILVFLLVDVFALFYDPGRFGYVGTCTAFAHTYFFRNLLVLQSGDCDHSAGTMFLLTYQEDRDCSFSWADRSHQFYSFYSKS